MVRGTRLARSATRARAHRASRHRLRGSHYGLRSFMLPRTASKTDDDVANGTDDERVRSPRSGTASSVRVVRHRPALFQAARPSPPTILVPPLCPPAQVWRPGRSGRPQDDDAAAGDACADAACADAACADARLAMLPRPHLASAVASEAVGPHRPTRSCELPDA